MKIVRRATFNAAHRLYRKDWSNEKNDEVFGLCNNVNYHGHNYVLEVGIEGKINPETGYIIDVKILKNIIKTEIEDRYDHKNLNLDCPEFFDLNPTVIAICSGLVIIAIRLVSVKYRINLPKVH